MTYVVEPSGRDDEWAFHVVRLEYGVIIGFHQTKERAEAFIQAEALRLGLYKREAA